MKKIVLLLLTLSLCLVASADKPAYRSIPLELTPGHSAGPILIGQPLSPAVFEKLGQPSKKNATMVLWSISDQLNFEEGVMVKLDAQGNVASIYLAYVNLTTSGGARQGDTLSALQKAHPSAKYVEGRGGNYLRMPGLEIALNMENKAELFIVTTK